MPQHYPVTLTDAIAHYQSGDLTAKGLLHFYFKIHPENLTSVWESAIEVEEIRTKLGIEKSTFHSALNRLHEEKAI
jgi:predicted transcriptional regulator